MGSEEGIDDEEKAETPPPAYVEPTFPDGTTEVVAFDKERPDSAWEEPAPQRDPQRLNTHLQVPNKINLLKTPNVSISD